MYVATTRAGCVVTTTLFRPAQPWVRCPPARRPPPRRPAPSPCQAPSRRAPRTSRARARAPAAAAASMATCAAHQRPSRRCVPLPPRARARWPARGRTCTQAPFSQPAARVSWAALCLLGLCRLLADIRARHLQQKKAGPQSDRRGGGQRRPLGAFVGVGGARARRGGRAAVLRPHEGVRAVRRGASHPLHSAALSADDVARADAFARFRLRGCCSRAPPCAPALKALGCWGQRAARTSGGLAAGREACAGPVPGSCRGTLHLALPETNHNLPHTNLIHNLGSSEAFDLLI